jgi:hypothetical protein
MKLNLKALVLTAGLVWAGAVLMVGVTNLIWPGYGNTFLPVVPPKMAVSLNKSK